MGEKGEHERGKRLGKDIQCGKIKKENGDEKKRKNRRQINYN